MYFVLSFFFNDTATTEIYTLSLHDALPICGYAFQNVGPRDGADDPIGGRSVIEVGAEVRFRYKNFGLVPFIDGGNVFDDEIPKFDQKLQWGVGLGVRYYSKLGPLRLDLALPINKRNNDDPLAFYISIGQAF